MSKAAREYKRKITTMRTLQGLKRQISKLEEMKEEYIRKAKDAKLKGNTSSYSVARSGLKSSIMQLKKLEVMLLNMELVVQQRDFASLSGSFVKSMEIASKELQKEIGKMNFSKTAGAFHKAFMSAGIANEQMQALLEDTEDTYATMTDNGLDIEIDKLIGAEAVYEEELIDRKLDSIRAGGAAAPERPLQSNLASVHSSALNPERSFPPKASSPLPKEPNSQFSDANSRDKSGVPRENTAPPAKIGAAELKGAALRPISWEDFQGQPAVKKKLQESISAAKIRKEPLKHILLYGPPGLGKTTVAKIIANEMHSAIHEVHGLNLKTVSDVGVQLKQLKDGDILFIDEIHCVSPKAQESLYMALEDFKFTFTERNKLITKNIPRFTLIGATTHAGRLNKPFLDRIGNQFILQRYPKEEIQRIIINMFKNMGFSIDETTALVLAERCRGVPRIARNHCDRLADKALTKGGKNITADILREYLDDIKLDILGLTENDIKLLESLITLYGGGPAGLNTLANCIGVNEEEIKGNIEPYLNYIGMLNTLPGGRVATEKAYRHLGYTKIETQETPSKTEPGNEEATESKIDHTNTDTDTYGVETASEAETADGTQGKNGYVNFAERDVREILAELGESYIIYNNVLIKNDERYLEIDHIALSKFGIFVIETKNYSGKITGFQHSEFFTQTKANGVKRFYNPILQNAGHIKALSEILGDYPFYSIIVFSDRAELDVDSTTIVCNVNGLKGHIENILTPILDDETLKIINEALKESIITDEAVLKEHIDGVKRLTLTKRAIFKKGICPACGSKMMGKDGENGPILQCPDCGYKT